jgi:hypothetical protein
MILLKALCPLLKIMSPVASSTQYLRDSSPDGQNPEQVALPGERLADYHRQSEEYEEQS